MDSKATQPKNTVSPIIGRLLVLLVSSKITDTKAVHWLNALVPILCTLAGIVMDVKKVQYENALDPIVSTLAGMVMDGIMV